VEDYKRRTNEVSKSIIKTFERSLKSVVPFGLKAKPDPDSYDEEAMRRLREQLGQLKADLLELEADQYDALGSVIAVAIGQYESDGVEQIIRANFEALSKIESDFQSSLKLRLDLLYEERQKQEGAETIYHSNQNEQTKQAMMLMENKEEYQKVLAEWAELHRKKLEEMEGVYVKNEEAIIKERTERINREEMQRNRSRIGEIHVYIDRMSEVINQWEQSLD
jgi:hypothetical protein